MSAWGRSRDATGTGTGTGTKYEYEYHYGRTDGCHTHPVASLRRTHANLPQCQHR